MSHGDSIYCKDKSTIAGQTSALGVNDPEMPEPAFNAIPPTAAEITSNNKNASVLGGK